MAKILVVEDEGAIRGLFHAIFKSEGHDVIEAKNGREALELIAMHPAGTFDLIHTDWHMPEVDGLSLAIKLKSSEQTKDVPIILCFGETECDFEVPQNFKKLFSGETRKPVRPSVLLASIVSVLQHSHGACTMTN